MMYLQLRRTRPLSVRARNPRDSWRSELQLPAAGQPKGPHLREQVVEPTSQVPWPLFLNSRALVMLTFQARRLLLPSAHCRWKAGLLAKITLNGLQLSVLDSEILHVPERFTVLGVAKILHKSIVRASGDSLQVKMVDEIDLGFPASRLESALADVVVAGCAAKSKVIGEQAIHGAPVFRI